MSGLTAATVVALMAWVSQVSGLPVTATPEIAFAYSAPDGRKIYHTATSPGGMGAGSIPGKVFLPIGWDWANPVDYCILAHEITHVLQYASGKHYDTIADMEPLAYMVEDYCLTRRGHPGVWATKFLKPVDVPGVK